MNARERNKLADGLFGNAAVSRLDIGILVYCLFLTYPGLHCGGSDFVQIQLSLDKGSALINLFTVNRVLDVLGQDWNYGSTYA